MRLRLAVYGHVNREAGSSPSAFSLLLERMLERGHEIEFFAIDGFVRATELRQYAGFAYVPIRIPWAQPGFDWIEGHASGFIKRGCHAAFNDVQRYAHEEAIRREILARNERRPYDALLVVDRLCPFDVAPLRVVSWTQGPPDAELDAIRRLPRVVRNDVGAAFHTALRVYYPYRVLRDVRVARKSQAIVCGSRWAASKWVAWVPSDAVTPLPFPVDLGMFRPASPKVRRGGPVFLWLGRIVPRKRLDLVAAAMRIVLREMPTARLLVVGSPAYGGRVLELLRDTAIAHAVEHRARVARADVPALLAACDVLVQPSENENFGTSVGEALASGLPVVLGPTNGTADYVGEAGFLCDRYSPDSVADAMLRAAREIAVDAGGVAVRARRAAEQFFDADRAVDRLVPLLSGH